MDVLRMLLCKHKWEVLQIVEVEHTGYKHIWWQCSKCGRVIERRVSPNKKKEQP